MQAQTVRSELTQVWAAIQVSPMALTMESGWRMGVREALHLWIANHSDSAPDLLVRSARDTLSRLLTTRLWRPAGSSRSFPGQGLVAGALSWRSLAWPVQELPHLPEARPSRGDWGGWDIAWSRS